ILRTFSHYVRDGLLPDLFPEGEREALYHTVDATLWYFHAIGRYVQVTGDRSILPQLYPVLAAIIEQHIAGTRFNIHVDPTDGLITAAAEGYQLTWMDAKVDGWVVTPRRGKPVEIQALWINALRLVGGWADSADYRALAGRGEAGVPHPRRGKGCEIGGLWFTALPLFGGWADSADYGAVADRAESAFRS